MGVWLRDLPAALTGWGFDVRLVEGWQTRGHGPLLRSPRGVVDHWTATPFTSYAKPFPTAELVKVGRSDLPGPLCNLQIGFGGQVSVVAAGLAYHAGPGNRGVPFTGNSDSIGIECEGDGRAWTPEQIAQYPRVCAALWHWYADVKLSNIVAHYEWTTRKIDINTWPGGMSSFRQAVQAATKGEDWLMALDQKTQDLVAESAGTIDRTFDVKFRSQAVDPETGKQSEWEGWLSEFIVNTNADAFQTRQDVAKLLAATTETNRLLAQLVEQGKTK